MWTLLGSDGHMTGNEPGSAATSAQKGQRQDLGPQTSPNLHSSPALGRVTALICQGNPDPGAGPGEAGRRRDDHLRVFFRPDGIGTVTAEERERFEEIKERLRVLLENQITHFRLGPRSRTWCWRGPELIRLAMMGFSSFF